MSDEFNLNLPIGKTLANLDLLRGAMLPPPKEIHIAHIGIGDRELAALRLHTAIPTKMPSAGFSPIAVIEYSRNPEDTQPFVTDILIQHQIELPEIEASHFVSGHESRRERRKRERLMNKRK